MEIVAYFTIMTEPGVRLDDLVSLFLSLKVFARMYYHSFLVSREMGGAAVLALRLTKWMSQQGATPQVWIPGAGAAAQTTEQEGLPWRSYALDSCQKGKLPHALACLRLVPWLQFRRGWAYVTTPVVYRLLRPALRLAGLRTAVAVHLDPAPEEIRWAFRDPPDLVLPCARYLSDFIRQTLGEKGEKLRIVALPNAVDTERFYPGDRAVAKQRLNAPPQRPLALMLANLAPHKGQETVIRAVAELKTRGTDIECWLAGIERGGRQEYGPFLQSLAAELGVADRVRFLGFRADGPELLRAADFLLLPSTHEGLPLSILEAQASKVPVLAAPTAGIPEVVADDQTGFLIPANDSAGYARRLEDLMRNPERGQRITETAYSIILREYTMPAYCRRVQGLLLALPPAA
jgi:glycosyltransferase involved in cell wall biosynthesis